MQFATEITQFFVSSFHYLRTSAESVIMCFSAKLHQILFKMNRMKFSLYNVVMKLENEVKYH